MEEGSPVLDCCSDNQSPTSIRLKEGVALVARYKAIVIDVMPAPRPCGGTLLALDGQRIIVSDEGLDGTIGLGHFTFEGFGSSHNRVVITESQ